LIAGAVEAILPIEAMPALGTIAANGAITRPERSEGT
jgi:hypothetical protein